MNEDFDIKGDLNFGDVGFDIGDIDSSLFEVDFDGGDQIETRYVRPTLKPIKKAKFSIAMLKNWQRKLMLARAFAMMLLLAEISFLEILLKHF